MAKKVAFAVILSFILSGCTSVLSTSVVQEADDKVTFTDLQKQPDRYRGTVVILGGQIIDTVVKESETRVLVLQLPLGAQQRPDNTASSQGRFIVIFKRFADPLVYERGRKITVAGVVQGGQVIKGEHSPKTPLELPYWKGQLSMLNICWKPISVKNTGVSGRRF